MVEPEPSAWELMRAIQALNDTVEKLGSNMMTAAMFDIHQKGTDRRFETMEKQIIAEKETRSREIVAEKEARVKEVGAVENRLNDDAKFRRQVVASVLVGIALAVFSIVVSLTQAGPPS